MNPGSAPEARPQVTICGLGPGNPNLATEATVEALTGGDPIFLRTGRHPGTDRLSGAVTFDHIYDRAESFDEVYRTIADEVAAAAVERGHVVYAVPGSPLVLERSVRALRSRSDLAVRVLPAISFLDEVWARLQIDPVDDGVRLVDGLAFATAAADQRGPILVAHAHANWVLSDIKLAMDAGPEQPVVVLQRLGTEHERVFEVEWPDLDRVVEADHLTSLYLPEVIRPVGFQLAQSVEMMARLRRDCPWDREQTHRSLRKYLIEEAYEVIDAIDGLPAGDPDGDGADAYADLEEELGDLWFQVLFHCQLAAEAGQFTIAEVAESLCEKMIRRHPHVYGDPSSGQVDQAVDGSIPGNWERLKQEEKGRRSALDGIPSSLPALALTEKILKKAAGAGAPADHQPLEDRLSAIPTDVGEPERHGEVLLALVELGRRQGVNSEQALRDAAQRAAERFRAQEARGQADGRWVLG